VNHTPVGLGARLARSFGPLAVGQRQQDGVPAETIPRGLLLSRSQTV
jgi:hypothetical protein